MLSKRARLQNKDFTLITNNCLAGCLYHDLGLQFATPTINLYMPFPDYINFLKDFKNNIEKDLVNISSDDGVPSASLGYGGGKIIFLHYDSFEAASKAWNRRKERINFDNLYAVLVERDGCTHEDLRNFIKLPIKNKIALVHKNYDDIEDSFVIKGFENQEQLGNIMDYVGYFGKRYYDQFDWINFLNNK